MAICTCVNCQTRIRWEVLYKAHEKSFPNHKEFIQRLRAHDLKYLPCFYKKARSLVVICKKCGNQYFDGIIVGDYCLHCGTAYEGTNIQK